MLLLIYIAVPIAAMACALKIMFKGKGPNYKFGCFEVDDMSGHKMYEVRAESCFITFRTYEGG